MLNIERRSECPYVDKRARLTDRVRGAIHEAVKSNFKNLLALAVIASGTALAQPGTAPALPDASGNAGTAETSIAPPEVEAAAVAAVNQLGDEVVRGRYQVAVERMNPLWKERTAARVGGMEALEKQLSGVAQQMVQQGISMISFSSQGAPRSFEVWPGKKVEKVDGVDQEVLIYTKWLVLVPTVTKFRVIRPGDPKPLVIESTGFQVAVSDKGKNDWTFIDGSGLSVNDLRRLYINLPQDLELPPLGKREAR